MSKTVQLRRYEIKPGEFDDFLAWWSDNIPELRRRFGFTIEFAYEDRANNQFVWAVSVPGDETDFEATEKEYLASDERAKAFDGVPQRVERQVNALVKIHVG